MQPAVSVTIGWLFHLITRDLFSREVHVNAMFLKASHREPSRRGLAGLTQKEIYLWTVNEGFYFVLKNDRSLLVMHAS